MNSFDIFGSQVSVRFKGSPIYKTKFGAFISVLVFCIILLRLSFLVSSLIQGKNPIVLFQERPAQDPKKFTITPQTLSLALGVQDTSYKFIIDDSIYTIQDVHKTKQNVFNQTTGKYDQVFTTKKFSLVNCTEEHVPDPELRQFFLKSQLQMHQCIPKDLVVGIEGQFNSDFYQELNFYFYKCKGQYCKDQNEIDALLNNNFIDLLFTDVNFSPENKENPFNKFSRDLYWATSQNLPRKVNMYMRNNYVESDFGWVTSDVQTQIYPSLSYVDNQVADPSVGFFFQLIVRFEKEKENLYKRNYENLFTILSQIGGFSQILLTIFSFICLKYSQIHLGRSLINQSFEFSQTQDSNNQGTLISNPTLHQNKTETLENQGFQNNFKPKPLSPAATPHMKESSFQLQMSQNIQGSPIYAKEDRISLFHHPQQSPSEDSPQKINKKISQNIGKKLSDEKILEDFQKQQEICKNQQTLHFNVFSYMLSFVTQIFKSVRDKRKVVDYGLKAISNNLDVEFIIKKFIEIDKLKRIILNDDQLALFNYIPKPQINYKIHPSQGVVIEKNSLFGNDDNLNDFEKFKKAKHSFINIVEKQKQTKIDQSILNLLDHKHYQILSNKLDQKQSPNLQLSGNQMQTLQPLSPQYQSEMSNVRLVKKIINQDEAEEDSTEDNFDSNKIKQYSTFKKVRNPSQYYSTSNQEKQIYCVLQKKPFLISFYLKNRLKIYSIQDSVQEKL